MRWKLGKFWSFDVFFLFWRLPFNWKTPLGYLIALLIQCIETTCDDFSGLPVACFLFQSCQLFEAFVEDIARDVSLLDIEFCSSEANRHQATENFVNVLRNFTTVKQLSDAMIFDRMSILVIFAIFWSILLIFRFVYKFNECYEFIITDISLWSNIMITTTLLTIQFELVE